MIVYLLNILLILFWSVLLLNVKSPNKKLFCGLVGVQWTLISGLRHISIGADTYAYKLMFDSVDGLSWEKALNNLRLYFLGAAEEINDPGYSVLEKTFRLFSDNYQLFLLFIGALFSISLAVWVYKNSKMPCLSFIIYSTLFYSFFAITGHRQTIATALIVLIGYEYIKQRNLVKFLIVSMIACAIHKSALVFVPVYFIANIPITKTYAVGALAAVVVVTILGNRVYGPLVELVGFAEEQLGYNGHSANTYAFVLLLVCVAILSFYPHYKDRAKYPNHIFNITLLTLMTDLAVFSSQGFMRVQQYYSLFIMLFIPEVIMCLDEKNRTLCSMGAIGILILYLIRNNPQYLFCF